MQTITHSSYTKQQIRKPRKIRFPVAFTNPTHRAWLFNQKKLGVQTMMVLTLCWVLILAPTDTPCFMTCIPIALLY